MTKTAVPTYEQPGFDVTCTIGRVIFGAGDQSPYAAAFALIAEHGAPGSYSFPHEDGTATVEVTHYA